MVGFFEVLSCVQYKESFYISFTLYGKKPQKQVIVPASQILQLLCLFVLKMTGSIRTILPDSEL